MQKHVDLVDLVKSFPTNIFLQNLASIQKRTSPLEFAHLAEISGKGSISNLSTKVSKEEFEKNANEAIQSMTEGTNALEKDAEEQIKRKFDQTKTAVDEENRKTGEAANDTLARIENEVDKTKENGHEVENEGKELEKQKLAAAGKLEEEESKVEREVAMAVYLTEGGRAGDPG